VSIARAKVYLAIPRALGALTVLTLIPLIASDGSPRLFPPGAHRSLAAIPLALIALACIAHPLVGRAPPPALAKGILLAAAFQFWAANQFWPQHPFATLFNDSAIALFVVDVFLAIRGVDHAAASGFDHAPAEPETCRRPRARRRALDERCTQRKG
jgi:hypothetical protein